LPTTLIAISTSKQSTLFFLLAFRPCLHSSHTHTQTRTHARIHTHTHTRARARAHARTHTHTHTHTHTRYGDQIEAKDAEDLRKKLKDLREFVNSEDATAESIKERVGAVQKDSLKVFDAAAKKQQAEKKAAEGEDEGSDDKKKKADDAEFEDVNSKKKK
jgi:hypothetical protein